MTNPKTPDIERILTIAFARVSDQDMLPSQAIYEAKESLYTAFQEVIGKKKPVFISDYDDGQEGYKTVGKNELITEQRQRLDKLFGKDKK